MPGRPNRKSLSWKFITQPTNSTISCTLCGWSSSFHNNTTNQTRHLKNQHKKIYEAALRCSDLPNDKELSDPDSPDSHLEQETCTSTTESPDVSLVFDFDFVE